MKNFKVRLLFFFLFFLLNSTLVLAQDAYQIKVASIFQNVYKSQVPTQYLKEFGYSFMPMDYFKGVLADTNVFQCS